MSETVVIVVPMLPPRECSPNWHGHWRERYDAGAEYHALARAFANQVDGEQFRDGVVVMDIEVAWCCGRKRMDDDNLIAAVKPARDGIADALFGGDDSRMQVGTVTQRRGDGVTIVTLRGEGD